MIKKNGEKCCFVTSQNYIREIYDSHRLNGLLRIYLYTGIRIKVILWHMSNYTILRITKTIVRIDLRYVAYVIYDYRLNSKRLNQYWFSLSNRIVIIISTLRES